MKDTNEFINNPDNYYTHLPEQQTFLMDKTMVEAAVQIAYNEALADFYRYALNAMEETDTKQVCYTRMDFKHSLTSCELLIKSWKGETK